MKRTLQILLIIIIVSSCGSESKLEGVWFGAYTISDGIKKPLLETTLLQFEGDQLHTLTISNQSVKVLDGVTADKTEYKLSNGKLEYGSHSQDIQFSKDSLILEFEYEKLVLRRIQENLKNLEINNGCFRGSYFIQSKYYQDSIHFVNDSLLIYTGDNHESFPAKKWQIVEFGGFKFLNVLDYESPLLIIKSCSLSDVDMIYPSTEVIDIKLKSTKSRIDQAQLIGEWKEILNSNPPPPPPAPNLTRDDYMRLIKVNNDSIKIKRYNREKSLKWSLSSDGKRIYFPNRLLENEGSWKLLSLTDSLMKVSINSQSGFKDEIVEFRKVKKDNK